MPETTTHDEQLASILQALSDLPMQQRPSLDALTREHPQFADELRQLWGAMMVVDAVAQRTSTPEEDQVTEPYQQIALAAAPPQRLGDFELQQEIGRGGMGVVYRARQRSLERDVAVKIMIQGAGASAGDLARFETEAAAAARLDHPNIVPIYETGLEQGWRYIGMKLVSGETLSARMAAGPMPEREAAALVLKIARAIQYAHDRGVIHRDLKPANILIDGDGEPHVSDFGLAKRPAADPSVTASGAILGTPSYMAPEQAAGDRSDVGPVSDVFSLGGILYALLTGRPPFQGPTPVDTVLLVLEEDPLPPRLLNAQLSRDLEMIVLRSLQKPIELRYATAAALADDLKAFLAGERVAARSGQFSHIIARLFGDKHHAAVLRNWGLLWMWHAALLLVLCLVTNAFHLLGDEWPQMRTVWPYALLWGLGLAVWAPTFWALRSRAGPVTAVERQIAHAWGGSIVAVMLLFAIEALLRLPVLTLSPVLGLISGMVFVVKAGILAGSFYINAAALFASAVVMAFMQSAGNPYGTALFGLIASAAFFIPGWKYHRLNLRSDNA